MAARRPGADIVWDPLTGPSADGLEGAGAMLLLSGVVAPERGDLALNTELALAAAGACAALGIPRLLVASTAAVYGAGRGAPLSEDAPLDPASEYGAAKAAMEMALRGAPGPGAPEICCLRIGNVAGCDALLMAAHGATAEQPLRLDRFSGGRGPRRSYIGPLSLARVVEALATAPGRLPFLINVAAPRPVYMDELLEAAGIPWRHRDAPPGALQDITLDTARLSALCPLPDAASDPAGIVGEWRRTGGAE